MKDIRRMIGATKGRFFSLTAIVTIGVAFFVGVSSSSSVMSASVDKYDDELNLKDITIYSNYGFDQEDLTAVKKLSEVSDAELSYFVDVTATADANSMITRIHSYNASSAINQFVGNFQTAFNPQIVKLYASDEKEQLLSLIYKSSSR